MEVLRCDECGRIEWGWTLRHWRACLFVPGYRKAYRQVEAMHKMFTKPLEVPPGTTIHIPHTEAIHAKDLTT